MRPARNRYGRRAASRRSWCCLAEREEAIGFEQRAAGVAGRRIVPARRSVTAWTAVPLARPAAASMQARALRDLAGDQPRTRRSRRCQPLT